MKPAGIRIGRRFVVWCCVLLGAAAALSAAAGPGSAAVVGHSGAHDASSLIFASPGVQLPEVLWLDPSQAKAGSPDFTVTVIGSGFVQGSTVLWNGDARDTGFLSQTILTATIRASDVAQPTTAYVSVLNPGPTGGHSPTARVFTVSNPQPAVDAITPDKVWAGSDSFVVSVSGSGFVPESTVQVAGVDVQTEFVSSRVLTGVVPQQVVRYAAVVSVRVYTPEPGGGLSSLLFLEVADDDVAPVTTATGLSSLWNRAPVTLELVATDVGRGVERTFYRVGTSGDYLVGDVVVIPAPANHSNDGLHVVQFFSIDRVLNWEQPIKEIEVGIDTTPPTTSVGALTVRSGGRLSPKYYVYDALSPRARDAVLQIVDRKGRVVQRCVLGKPATRTWHNVSGFTVKVPRGTYKMRVLAHDLAGNAQSSTKSAVLTVK